MPFEKTHRTKKLNAEPATTTKHSSILTDGIMNVIQSDTTLHEAYNAHPDPGVDQTMCPVVKKRNTITRRKKPSTARHDEWAAKSHTYKAIIQNT